MIFHNYEWVKNESNAQLPFIKDNPILANYIFTQSNSQLGILSKEGYLTTTEDRLKATGVLDKIKSTDNVLDLGCAEGQMEYILKDKCKYILGIERHPSPYTVAEEFKKIFKYSNVDFINDDILKLDTLLKPDQLFDHILFFNVVIWNNTRAAKKPTDNIYLLNTIDYLNVLDIALGHLTPNGTLYMTNKWLQSLLPELHTRYKDKYCIKDNFVHLEEIDQNQKTVIEPLYYIQITQIKDRD